uniref:Uncharacterized protein n=1 Tax=Picea glauca TaxID=3330 RepID=A0A101M3I4_PICGL|nr:hypothetical protein ABT39_MTgene121 [Picea glauca]
MCSDSKTIFFHLDRRVHREISITVISTWRKGRTDAYFNTILTRPFTPSKSLLNPKHASEFMPMSIPQNAQQTCPEQTLG